MREAFLQQPRKRKRKQAVRLRKQGMTYAQIANSVGVHERTVIRWIDACKSEGVKALKAQPLGRPMGAGRALSQTQEKAIQKLIADKTPDQLKMAYALWTRGAVKELIEQEFSIKLAIRIVHQSPPLLRNDGDNPKMLMRKLCVHNHHIFRSASACQLQNT
ncbi:MAG: helix-turn-helix domain-containing protein [Candidatus Thiodiazotropha taylori]